MTKCGICKGKVYADCSNALGTWYRCDHCLRSEFVRAIPETEAEKERWNRWVTKQREKESLRAQLP